MADKRRMDSGKFEAWDDLAEEASAPTIPPGSGGGPPGGMPAAAPETPPAAAAATPEAEAPVPDPGTGRPDWFRIHPDAERRAAPRYEIMAQVRVKKGKVTHLLDVRNVSRSGLFVSTDNPKRLAKFRIGQEVELDLFTTEVLENVPVRALVVRVVSDGPPAAWGFGVHFVQVTDDTQRRIDELVSLAASGTLAPRPPPLPTRFDPHDDGR